MKKFLVIFCSVTLVATVSVFAYNRDKGPAKQKDGITELSQPVNDSVFTRGRYLLNQSGYNEQDLEAISVYLNNR